MKKIKISDLPLYSSLKGLFTIGTDADNRSVKVSLEFIEQKTNDAVTNAEAAIKDAQKATELANNAAGSANTAAKQAQEARELAEKAAQKANDAAATADKSTEQAQEATQAANTAAQSAQQAKKDADAATKAAQTATQEAQEATEAAEQATEKLLDTLSVLVPTAMKTECVSRITTGNVGPIYIKTELEPENALKNLIFISDNKAVEVSQDGQLTIVGKGRSRVQVIPTLNTSLAKSLLIEVGEPTARLVTRNSLRFTQTGAFRFN